MLKNYIKKKSKFGLAIDLFMLILLVLLLIPATRKNTAAFILKPTLFIHQPKVKTDRVEISTQAYNWQLKNLDGEGVSLSELSGKVVFINLWATWCPPCIAELPDLIKLYDDYGDKVVFLFISNESLPALKAFVDKKGYQIPVYFPVTGYPADFEANSIPTTFIVNKKGEIVVQKNGVAKWNSNRTRNILNTLIAE